MNESCHIRMSHVTYEWVMSHHIWMSHVRYERVMSRLSLRHKIIDESHVWMSHVTRMNESRHTYEWVTSHVWMSHVTHQFAAPNLWWITRMNDTYERVMSHMNESHHIWMSHVTPQFEALNLWWLVRRARRSGHPVENQIYFPICYLYFSISYLYVAWLIHMWRDMTHSYVTWLIHMWHDFSVTYMYHSSRGLSPQKIPVFPTYITSVYFHVGNSLSQVGWIQGGEDA